MTAQAKAETSAQPQPVADGDCPACSTNAAVGQQTCSCHYKQTPRSQELQEGLQKRLNRIIGQLHGVKGMLDENRYCGDVLTQLAAAQSALKGVSQMLLKDHLETCVVEHIQAGDTEVIDEVMRLFKKFQ